jgi:ribosomal protein S18 acetylase RimI-like enzyme
MTGARFYPDEPAGRFPAPPRTFTDSEGREIDIRDVDWDRDREAIVSMYESYDSADRAQGIPPVGRPSIERWLEDLTGGPDLAAWAGEDVVGHATLVPDEAGGYELAIFVVQGYQDAGIGTALLETLLGRAQAADIEQVWLTVERWNRPAVRIYERAGFETTDAASFELEMSIRL